MIPSEINPYSISASELNPDSIPPSKLNSNSIVIQSLLAKLILMQPYKNYQKYNCRLKHDQTISGTFHEKAESVTSKKFT